MHLEKTYPWEKEAFSQRLIIYISIIIFLFLILVGRLWYLQIIQGVVFQNKSEVNSVQPIRVPALRGIILDRNGEVLVENKAQFNLFFNPWILENVLSKEVIERLSKILNIEVEKIKEKITSTIPSPFEGLELANNLDLRLVTQIFEQKSDLPGVTIESCAVRSYPYSKLASHSLGYLREIDKEELVNLKSGNYRLGDLKGQAGIEKVYDRILRGKDGCRWIEVNAYGRPLGVLRQSLPISGNNIVLTIDQKIQKIAEESLRDKLGAVVVINPGNGEILGLVSKPDYPLDIFTHLLLKKDWDKLIALKKPFINRTIQGKYPPGSLFKIITAIAALEKDIIRKNDLLSCKGVFNLGDHTFHCFEGRSHGDINIKEALEVSCNLFFIQLGLKVGAGELASFARKFGLGEKTGINLVGEKKGLVPDPWWKRIYKERRWYLGDTANMSIGQGYLLVTPLQMANLVAVVANGGKLFKPYLVKEIRSSKNNKVIATFKPQKIKSLSLKNSTLRIIRESLHNVIKKGTGWRANIPEVEIAGKTGTAQNSQGNDHAWFVGYAPFNSPKIVVVVFVECGGEGGKIAAPIASKIFKEIFTNV